MAIVICCAYPHKQSSPLTTYWKVEFFDKAHTKPYVIPLDVDCIVWQYLMIPKNDNLNGYHEVWEREH